MDGGADPGVIHAVRWLHDRGNLLLTASGESSVDLEGYLAALVVVDSELAIG